MVCGIVEQEAHGYRVLPVFDQYYLEETVWYRYLMFSDAFRMFLVVYRAAYDVYPAVFTGPAPAHFFQVTPVIPVQFLVLRADVAHVEGLCHSLFAPFHVGGRSHVPTVVTGAGVVGVFHPGLRQVRVWNEPVFPVFFPSGLFAGQFPSHPVGSFVRRVIGQGIADSLQDDFIPFLQSNRYFQVGGVAASRRG